MGLVFLLLPLALANVRGEQTIVLLSFMKEPNLDNFFLSPRERCILVYFLPT